MMTPESISEPLRVIVSSGLVSLVFYWIASKFNFFLSLDSAKPKSSLTFLHVLIVFTLYTGINVPVALFLDHFLSLLLRPVSLQEQLTLIGVLQFVLTLFSAVLMIGFTKLLAPPLSSQIIKSPLSKSSILTDFIIGCSAWLLCFPLVTFISQVSEIILSYFVHSLPFEQSAVNYFKKMSFSPFITALALIHIVILAPIVEELIFRGFLLTWLQKILGSKGGLIVSSLAFSLFHFSPTQGYGNIIILIALFILALYLGYLYLRQKSIYAPIALHMTFNLISALRILFGLDS